MPGTGTLHIHRSFIPNFPGTFSLNIRNLIKAGKKVDRVLSGRIHFFSSVFSSSVFSFFPSLRPFTAFTATTFPNTLNLCSSYPVLLSDSDWKRAHMGTLPGIIKKFMHYLTVPCDISRIFLKRREWSRGCYFQGRARIQIDQRNARRKVSGEYHQMT